MEKFSFRVVRFKLESAGFTEVFQLGNHAKFIKRTNFDIKTAILPHYSELAGNTVRSVLVQAGLSLEEFLSL